MGWMEYCRPTRHRAGHGHIHPLYQGVGRRRGCALGARGAVLHQPDAGRDADSRWALAWFEQAGFAEGEYGVAETLSTAKNTSVAGMVEAGILHAGTGKVRLLRPSELPADWDPESDARLTVWEMVHHLVRVHDQEGEAAAAGLAAKLGAGAEPARELAYRLYRICDQKSRAQEALGYNALVQSWPELARTGELARVVDRSKPCCSTKLARDTVRERILGLARIALVARRPPHALSKVVRLQSIGSGEPGLD